MNEGFFSQAEVGSLHVLPRLPACDKCGLYRSCQSPKMKVYGQGKKNIMIVAEAPGEDEDRQNKPFVGKTGQYLQDILRECGIDMFRDCYCSNAVACRPPNNDTPDPAIEHCRPKIIREIEEIKPAVLILLGKAPVKSIIGHLWKENVKGITRWAGFTIPCQEWNCWICPTFHPSYVVRRIDAKDTVPAFFFKKHLKAAVAETTIRPWNPVPDYEKDITVELNPDAAANWVCSNVETNKPMAFDLETTTLKPDGPDAEIVCCSVATGDEAIAFPWTGDAIQMTLEALENPDIPKLGWNCKFESRWIKAKHDVTVRGWKMDGMLGAHVLDNRSYVTGLKFWAFAQLGIRDYDSEIKPFLKGVPEGGNNKNRIHEVNLRDLLCYCAYDSLYEYKLDLMIAEELGVQL